MQCLTGERTTEVISVSHHYSPFLESRSVEFVLFVFPLDLEEREWKRLLRSAKCCPVELAAAPKIMIRMTSVEHISYKTFVEYILQ